jgi:hypothetical protein
MRKAKWTGTWREDALAWIDGSWIDEAASQLSVDLTTQQAEKSNDVIKKALEDIDIASIRSLREWLIQQPNAPQFLLDHETQAQTERAKLK